MALGRGIDQYAQWCITHQRNRGRVVIGRARDRGSRRLRRWIWKTVGRSVLKVLRTGRLVRVFMKDVVDKAQYRPHRSKAVCDGPTRSPLGPQRRNVPSGPRQQCHLRIAKGIDRLLAVADDEDGWAQVSISHRCAFRPRRHQLADQCPLQRIGVLELIDENVLISRLEFVAAL